GQDAARRREVGQDIDGVADHEDRRAGGQFRALQALQYLAEQAHVAVDQLQPTLIGLAPQTGRNDDAVAAVHDRIVAGGRELDVRGRAGPGPQAGRLARRHVGVPVDQRAPADLAAKLHRKGRVRTDATASPDDADFHYLSESPWMRGCRFDYGRG